MVTFALFDDSRQASVETKTYILHDWNIEIEFYSGTDKRKLEMDNIQNHLHQLMDFDR
jgi:hypothetical protein